MEEKYKILIVLAGISAVAYLFFRKYRKAVPKAEPVPAAPMLRVAATPIVAPIPPAAGVSQTSGQVPTPPPPPPPAGVVARVRNMTNPTGPLRNIPVVGNTAANVTGTISRAPVRATLAVNSQITRTLEQIPVAGKVLALPSKVVGNVSGKVASIFGF
jgi:hypothetical protein